MGLGAFLKGAVKGVKGAVKKILPKKDSNSEGGSPAPSPSAPLMNSAFVFIKPHANTRAVQDLVVAKLTSKRVKILSEGDIAAAKIDKDKLIDQHYYAIASKATLLKPDQLPVPEDKFEAKFGIAWKQALADKLVYNAIDACTKLGVDADGLDAKWQAAKQAGGEFICICICICICIFISTWAIRVTSCFLYRHGEIRRWLLRRQARGRHLRLQRLLHDHALRLRRPRRVHPLLRRGVGPEGLEVVRVSWRSVGPHRSGAGKFIFIYV